MGLKVVGEHRFVHRVVGASHRGHKAGSAAFGGYRTNNPCFNKRSDVEATTRLASVSDATPCNPYEPFTPLS